MKNKINRRILGIILFLGFIFLFVAPVWAADGIVPCGLTGIFTERCTLCDLISGIKKLFDYGIKIIAVITLACATFAGVMYIVSSGNEGTMESAKKFLSASLIGFAVVLGAWVMVNTTITVLMPTKSDLGIGKSWVDFGSVDCATGTTGTTSATGALEINTATASSSLSEAKAGDLYTSDPITVTGAEGPIDWSVDGQPAGLDIKSTSDTTSVIFGMPDAVTAGTYVMTVTATDTGNVSMNNPGSIIFGAPAVFAAGEQSVSKEFTLVIVASDAVVAAVKSVNGQSDDATGAVCINSYCKGSLSKLTEARNGAGTCDNSQTFYNNSPGICGPGYGPGVVCCDGDWWADTRGGNWDSSCNGKDGGIQAGGWYVCNGDANTSNTGTGEKNIVLLHGYGSYKGINSQITDVRWNGLDNGKVCCDGNWWIKAAPKMCPKGYVCDTYWTGDCNGIGNGFQTGGFYQCGPNNLNGVTSGTPSVVILSPNKGGSFTAGSIIPLRWQTSGFPTKYAQIKLNLSNISLLPNQLAGGPYGLYTEATDNGSWDWATNADILLGQYCIYVTACDGFGENCISDKSEPFNIEAAGSFSVTVLSPNKGGSFAVGSILPIRWQTGGFPSQPNSLLKYAQIKLAVINISISYPMNHPGGAIGSYRESAPDSSEDLIIGDMLPGQYYVEVTACDSVGENCVSDKSEPFFIKAAETSGTTVPERTDRICVNDHCSGTNSKLTEARNGAGTCDNSQGFYNNNPGICGPGYGPGAVCCDGDWWIDSTGSSWDSSCNGKGFEVGGWYKC